MDHPSKAVNILVRTSKLVIGGYLLSTSPSFKDFVPIVPDLVSKLEEESTERGFKLSEDHRWSKDSSASI